MPDISSTEENNKDCPTKNPDTESLVKEVVGELGQDLALDTFDELPPDASSRRYYRLSLSSKEEKKPIIGSIDDGCLAMVFEQGESLQEVSGMHEAVAMEDAYLTLTRYFRSNQVEVPQVFADARDKGVILVEDLGDESLGKILLNQDDYTDKQIEIFFRMAIDEIIKIQNSKINYDLFAFQRSLNQEVYQKEVEEFSDYFLKVNLNQKKLNEEVMSSFLTLLCSDLAGRDKVLCHRDFHAWNLHLDSNGKVRVIDFQDALLGPSMYDVACLFNDRGADKLLGEDKLKTLMKYYLKESDSSESSKAKVALKEYNLCLLQRDLKVVGRFSKLDKEKNLTKYSKWIPDTLFRIGRTLGSLAESTKLTIYSNALDFLTENVKEIKEGSKSSFNFDDLV